MAAEDASEAVSPDAGRRHTQPASQVDREVSAAFAPRPRYLSEAAPSAASADPTCLDPADHAGLERRKAHTEADFVALAVQSIEEAITGHQHRLDGCFLLGISGTNGHVRRSRAADIYRGLASLTTISWRRVIIFLVDEQFDAPRFKGTPDDYNEESNFGLVQANLISMLRKNGIEFPDENFVFPDFDFGEAGSIGDEHHGMCALRYGERLQDLFARCGGCPHAILLGLGGDLSTASIFPEWFKGNHDRWESCIQKRYGALVTETTEFEYPKRLCCNLHVIRQAQKVILLLGGESSQDKWSEICRIHISQKKRHQARTSKAQNIVATRTVMHESDGIFMLHADVTKQKVKRHAIPGSPLEYILKHNPPTVVSLCVDRDSNHTFILLGGAGDLAKKKTFPSLYGLYLARYLPANHSIIGCDDPDFEAEPKVFDTADLWNNRLNDWMPKVEGHSDADLQEFRKQISFQPLKLDSEEKWKALHERILQSVGPKPNDHRVFYLALPPSLFAVAVQHIKLFCWATGNAQGVGTNKIIVEKPFGSNLQEAQRLTASLAEYIQEREIFRMDHYLAKTMVLNMLTLRFANRELGRLFHSDNVANIRITFKEDIDVEGRAGYFDKSGIIRDIMQNHLMQVLTLVAMEAPASLSPEDVRDEKVKVLKQIRPVDVENEVVIGQYNGYQQDPDIVKRYAGTGDKSRCPTFAVMVFHIDNERWSGVPFIMKAGKALETRSTILRIQFKKAPPNSLFGEQPQNELVIRIQPHERIYWKLLAKMPGLTQGVRDVQQTVLDLDIKKRMDVKHMPEAYEKLIFDVMQGQSHNFVRNDELEEAWRIFDPVLEHLEQREKRDPEVYEKRSRGPKKADELINRLGFLRYTVSGVPGFAADDTG